MPTPTRRVVRRRSWPALDEAADNALAELPAELRPLTIRYIETMLAANEARGELSTAMTWHNVRWADVDRVARALMSLATTVR